MNGCIQHVLDDGHLFPEGEVPRELCPTPFSFEQLWLLHPAQFPEIHLHGRRVRVPRWQQAYGADYRFSGVTSPALPVPETLVSLHAWVRHEIDDRLNGLLLNWYDAELGHYIGRHRDSTINMVTGAPIVTVSFGADRIFRLRPWKGFGHRDFRAAHGTVFIMPFDTNRAWTHEAPHFASSRGRRISVTFRAFATNTRA